jgi:hypothetical protein
MRRVRATYRGSVLVQVARTSRAMTIGDYPMGGSQRDWYKSSLKLQSANLPGRSLPDETGFLWQAAGAALTWVIEHRERPGRAETADRLVSARSQPR